MTSNRARLWGFRLLFFGVVLVITGLCLLLAPDRYRATVRIKIEHLDNPDSYYIYDPYFIQTEYEIIRSDDVLARVVVALHLDEEWGQRSANGHQLEMPDAISLIKRSLEMRPVRNTMMVDISFTSANPAEAASVANAIAQSYFAKRAEDSQRMVASWKQSHTNIDQEIKTLQAEVDAAKQQPDPTNSPAEKRRIQPPYDELQRMTAWRDYIANASTINVGVIIEPAHIPTAPANAHRRVGRDLLFAGILVILVGVNLLRRAHSAAPEPGSQSSA